MIAAGSRLGPYEIVAKLGEGGMGEVWRATDSRLKREVAIKVLPAAFTEDRERLARFEREAQVLAQLQHPGIAAIFGLEESGGSRALVMELVEGPTLAERLEAGPLPLAEAVAIARRIAEALEEAHAKGIAHRDLKPQNVKAGHDGRVKVLDFGLAKALDPALSGGASASKLAHSPTITAGATLQGVILGTAAYMSPEQAKGLPVDKRTDIWSLGVVLLEMLSGERAFAGDTVTETLAAVLRAEIPLGALPEGTPGSIRRLLRRCLERDPANRLHDVADVRIVLADLEAGRSDDALPRLAQPVARSRFAGSLVIGLVSAAVVAAFAAGWTLRRPPPRAQPPIADDAVVRKVTFEPGLEAEPSFSPDGNYVAFTTDARGSLDVAVLPVGGGEVRYLADSDADEAHPAWSPDGTRIAFSAVGEAGNGNLRALGGLGALTAFVQARGADIFLAPAAGGARVRLVERGSYPTWSPDGERIAFQSDRGGQWDIWRVRARGGEPEPVVVDEEVDYHPAWSPDGRWIAFASSSGLRIAPSDGGAPARRLIHDPSSILSPSWSADGRALYFSWQRTSSKASLWRLPLGSDGTALGSPERISLGGQSEVDLAIGAGGRRLVWSAAEYAPDLWELDRASGEMRQVTATTSSEDYPHLAPDGSALAFTSDRAGIRGIWILDRRSGVLEALTPPGTEGIDPRWSPDGRSLVFHAVDEKEGDSIVVQEHGGLAARAVGRAAATDAGLNGPQWSPDGQRLTYVRVPAQGEIELVVTPLAGPETTLARFPAGTTVNYPSFLADGSTIVFQRESGGEARQIWAVGVGGGEPRQLTRGALELSHPQGSPVDVDEILVVVDHKNLGVVSARTGALTLLTGYDDSTVVVDYPSWSADGTRVEFSLTRKIGDLFLAENPAP